MTSDDSAARVSRLYRSRFLRGYVRAKLRSDPVYEAAQTRLRNHTHPLFDLGCGAGVLAFYLRDRGITIPVRGVDHDSAKIAVARDIAASHFRDLEFHEGDAGDPIPRGMNVAALDVLHYFRDAEQRAILESIADAIPAGGIAVIRDAVRDGSFRYRMTAAQETFSRIVRWLKAERLNFPTLDTITAPFRRRGFDEEIVPMWGKTPFNNYLFVFRRSGDGTTRS